MNKHTPAPWTVHKSMRDCVTFEGQYGTENLFLENLDGYFACQSEADARLISAAPELLDALQALIDMDVAYCRGPAVEDAVTVARAAIAKATGEQS